MSAKTSLLVLAAGFAVLWASGAPKPSAAEPPVSLSSGHAHDNLTVFILRGPDVLDGKHILTLQEALDRGLAVVHETSSVNMLAVENLSPDHELFLQSGDIVKGGRQDRLISQDLLIQAKSGKVSCPANCCEHSRWQQRGGESAGKFDKSTDFAVGNDIKIANVAQMQGAVWDNVAKKQADLSKNVGKSVTENASPTSLQLALEDKDLRAKVAAYERELGGLANAYPDAVGAVIAVNGQVIASDVYGSRLLFQKAWPKLLKSAAADAVAQMPTAGAAVVATRADAEKFLAEQNQPAANAVAANPFADNFFALPEPSPALAAGNAAPNDEVQQLLDAARPVGDTRSQSAARGEGTTGFAGRSGATRERSLSSAGGNRDVVRLQRAIQNDLNPSNPAVADGTVAVRGGTASPATPTSAVVSFESRAGAQNNALIHRGQLKK